MSNKDETDLVVTVAKFIATQVDGFWTDDFWTLYEEPARELIAIVRGQNT